MIEMLRVKLSEYIETIPEGWNSGPYDFRESPRNEVTAFLDWLASQPAQEPSAVLEDYRKSLMMIADGHDDPKWLAEVTLRDAGKHGHAQPTGAAT
jgi:hypothetical protein